LKTEIKNERKQNNGVELQEQDFVWNWKTNNSRDNQTYPQTWTTKKSTILLTK
jgi:hypothetical protein